MGDDVNDVAAMKLAGMAAAPANAQPAARLCANFVSTNNGGNGAVRDLVEALLAARVAREELYSA
jgi:3-deoxy-D-manno-octulosonate 8-phosphate phosphatase (KDO 8-P phosphatase)